MPSPGAGGPRRVSSPRTPAGHNRRDGHGIRAQPRVRRGRSARAPRAPPPPFRGRSEEHTSELQSLTNVVCRLLLEKRKLLFISGYQDLVSCLIHFFLRLNIPE